MAPSGRKIRVPRAYLAVRTYRAFSRLPEDIQLRLELLEGQPYVTPPRTSTHQWTLGDLMLALGKYAEKRRIGELYPGPIDVVLDQRNVAAPDLVYVSRQRLEIIRTKNIRGAPDLVLELASPDTCVRDRVLKRRIYQRFGVRHYWLVDPDAHTVEEFVLEERTYRAGATLYEAEVFKPRLFRDLKIELASIWAPKFPLTRVRPAPVPRRT